VATLAFFEMQATAWARPSAAWARLTSTGAPANRLRVNTAATAQGTSEATTMKSGESSLMPTLAAWLRKPRGEAVMACGGCP
jgi:hypothetical protein